MRRDEAQRTLDNAGAGVDQVFTVVNEPRTQNNASASGLAGKRRKKLLLLQFHRRIGSHSGVIRRSPNVLIDQSHGRHARIVQHGDTADPDQPCNPRPS